MALHGAHHYRTELGWTLLHKVCERLTLEGGSSSCEPITMEGEGWGGEENSWRNMVISVAKVRIRFGWTVFHGRGFEWTDWKRLDRLAWWWFQHGIRPTFSEIPRAVSRRRGKSSMDGAYGGSRSRRREHKSDGGCVPWQITGPRFCSFARAYEWELKASRWERRCIGNNKYGHAARPYLFFLRLSS